jgi:hypothetical protein
LALPTPFDGFPGKIVAFGVIPDFFFTAKIQGTQGTVPEKTMGIFVLFAPLR